MRTLYIEVDFDAYLACRIYRMLQPSAKTYLHHSKNWSLNVRGDQLSYLFQVDKRSGHRLHSQKSKTVNVCVCCIGVKGGDFRRLTPSRHCYRVVLFAYRCAVIATNSGFIIVALCVTEERQLYFTSNFFSNTVSPPSLHRFSGNFATRRIGSSAMEHMYSKFCYVPLKEIRGQNPHFRRLFRTRHQRFAVSSGNVKKFYNSKTTAYDSDVRLTVRENDFSKIFF